MQEFNLAKLSIFSLIRLLKDNESKFVALDTETGGFIFHSSKEGLESLSCLLNYDLYICSLKEMIEQLEYQHLVSKEKEIEDLTIALSKGFTYYIRFFGETYYYFFKTEEDARYTGADLSSNSDLYVLENIEERLKNLTTSVS